MKTRVLASICLRLCLSVCLSAMSLCLSPSFSVFVCVCLSLNPSLCLSPSLSLHFGGPVCYQCTHLALSVCHPLSLRLCLSISICLFLSSSVSEARCTISVLIAANLARERNQLEQKSRNKSFLCQRFEFPTIQLTVQHANH